MSLALVQGYSSSEEEEDPQHSLHYHLSSSDDEDNDDGHVNKPARPSAVYEPSQPTSSSSVLPSASDVFSEISGPPAFLNNCVQEYAPQPVILHASRHRKQRKEKPVLPPGAVLESKAKLVAIRERVRSDLDGKQPQTISDTSKTEGGKRVATVTNPSAEDAAALLRMCLPCGIPKTYSNARGMVCPACGDRPAAEATDDSKKKGSTVKDKEKNKRMKGQSSHATWKSETEMQLRQQFD